MLHSDKELCKPSCVTQHYATKFEISSAFRSLLGVSFMLARRPLSAEYYVITYCFSAFFVTAVITSHGLISNTGIGTFVFVSAR